MQLQIHFLKSLLSLGLGYLRWTQLTPMVLMWGFGLLMLLALTFVNFQEQSLSLLGSFLEWLTRLPIIGEHVIQLLSDKDTSTHMATNNIESFIFSAWAVLSLVFFLAGMVLSLLFGPFQPWTLKRKILLAGAGVVVLLAGLVVNYYVVPQNFNGEASAWMLNFSLISLLVFVVSAYCLSVAHFLGYLNQVLMTSELKRPDNSRAV